MSFSLESVVQALQASLSPDRSQIRQASEYLQNLDTTPGYGIALLQIAGSDAHDISIRQAAAIAFKNFVKRQWCEFDENPIPLQDREEIKSKIVSFMTAVPSLIQLQIAESLSIISKYDFPEHWERLITELVEKMTGPGKEDYSVLNGVLEAASSIFERFVGAEDNTETRIGLKICLDEFVGPMTDCLHMLHKMFQQGITAPGVTKAQVEPLLSAMRKIVNCFYSLNWVTMTDAFEERVSEWMTFFHTYITANFPVVMSTPDDLEEGPLEALQGSIMKSIILYTDKYEDVFETYFPTFLQDSWNLLSQASAAKQSAPNMDKLVARTGRFLSSVVARPMHIQFFSAQSTLVAILEKIIIPNITYREHDFENFEDEPLDFFKSDVDGGDMETRRYMSRQLIRGLCSTVNQLIAPLVIGNVQRILNASNLVSDPNGVQKEAAITLFIALANQAGTIALGATRVNTFTDVSGFMKQYILPELNMPELEQRPLVKGACFKFILNFRNTFSPEELTLLLPICVRYMSSNNIFVHSYAAHTCDRILSLRQPVDSTVASTPAQSVPKLPLTALTPLIKDLLSTLLGRMASPSYMENEFLMRCVMRVCIVGKEELNSILNDLFGALTGLVKKVCDNPRNPHFNHYMFESIAALTTGVTTTNPQSIVVLEQMLIPHFGEVLTRNITDFLPYVFQLFTQFLNIRSRTPNLEKSTLPEAYSGILRGVVEPKLWLSRGNVPALTDLLGAYIRCVPDVIVASGMLMPILGIWQKLFTTRRQEALSFALLNAILTAIPMKDLSPRLPTIFGVILQFLQSNAVPAMRTKIGRGFTHSACLGIGIHGVSPIQTAIDSFGQGTFLGILSGIFVPLGPKVSGTTSRKETAIGLARLLTETSTLLSSESGLDTWNKLLVVAVDLSQPAVQDEKTRQQMQRLRETLLSNQYHNQDMFSDDVADATGDMDDVDAIASEYAASYSRLVHAGRTVPYAFRNYPNPNVVLAQALGKLSPSLGPGKLAQIIASSPVSAVVLGWIQSVGVVI